MYNSDKVGSKIIYPELSYEIVSCLFEVYNSLGGGYQEKHYQKALEQVFTERKITFIPQAPYLVKFKNKIIGRYYMDFMIEKKIILEIKRGDYFARTNVQQIKGYLQATQMQLGILANFTNNKMRYMRILNVYN